MSLASEYMLARLETGQAKAALRRHKGLSTGKAAAGWNRKPSDYAPLTPGERARHELEAREAWDAKAPELASDLMTPDDWSAYLGDDGEGWPDSLQAVRPVAVAQSDGPERQTPGERRQRKGNTMAKPLDAMSSREFSRICEAHFGSVYKAADALGLTYRQLRRMATGESDVHPAVIRLLRMVEAGKVKPQDLQ